MQKIDFIFSNKDKLSIPTYYLQELIVSDLVTNDDYTKFSCKGFYVKMSSSADASPDVSYESNHSKFLLNRVSVLDKLFFFYEKDLSAIQLPNIPLINLPLKTKHKATLTEKELILTIKEAKEE